MGNICNQAPEANSHQIGQEEGMNSKRTTKEEEESKYQRFHDFNIVVFCSGESEVYHLKASLSQLARPK
jgi:hypothetical protein